MRDNRAITKTFAAAIVGALTLTAPHAQSSADAVKVLSAIGMRQVMLELGPEFERATGHILSTTFDSTGRIAQRIAAGEDADVVLINRSAVESLQRDGKVVASSVADIARSVAAVAVRKGALKPDISSPDAFKRLLLSARSVSRPPPGVGGSSGDHIVDVLDRLGITGEVNAKSVFVLAGNPRQVAESAGDAVARGLAEVALHQLQELLAVPGIEVLGPFPADLQGSFTFAAARCTGAAGNEGGDALIAFLRTPRARAVMKTKGMEPL